jgi:DNA-binding HxlR family transcriptional regulator
MAVRELEVEAGVDHSECLRSLMAIRDALDVLNGKWKLQIIIAISSGQSKFKDIERRN